MLLQQQKICDTHGEMGITVTVPARVLCSRISLLYSPASQHPIPLSFITNDTLKEKYFVFTTIEREHQHFWKVVIIL